MASEAKAVERALIAFGSVDITPERPVALAGFTDRMEPWEAVHDALEMNGLLLRAGGQDVLLLCGDLLYFSEALRRSLAEEARRQLGLDESALLVAASHTHFAPATDPDKPLLGAVDAGYLERLVQQGRQLVGRLARATPTSVRLRYATTTAAHAVNRRRRGWVLTPGLPRRGTVGAVNMEGPKDETVHLLSLDDDDGRAQAVLWSYACHPVSWPLSRQVSADFPGVVRRRLRAGLGRPLPVLFLQGFTGDVRPLERGSRKTLRTWVFDLVNGPAFSAFAPNEYERWAESLAQTVAGPVLRGEGSTRPFDLHSRVLRMPLGDVLEEAPADRELVFRLIGLGERLDLVAVSAEPVADYAARLHALQPGRDVIPVGYIDGVFGYLPTRAVLEQGGYEAGGFLHALGLRGRFRDSVEETVMSAFHRLVGERAAAG